MIDELWLQKHASQCLSYMTLVHTSIHYLKGTGHIWMFCISNYCSSIRNALCVVWSCMRDLHVTRELLPQTCIAVVLCYIIVLCILQTCTYITIWCTTSSDNKTSVHVAYDCTHQRTALLPMMYSFVKTKLASCTTHCSVFSINDVR